MIDNGVVELSRQTNQRRIMGVSSHVDLYQRRLLLNARSLLNDDAVLKNHEEQRAMSYWRWIGAAEALHGLPFNEAAR